METMKWARWILPLAMLFIGSAAAQNILLLIADDYGADSCGLYNTNALNRPKIPTIESLATNGVVFRHAYANPICSPTRACIMTGRHGFRTGVGDAVAPGTPALLAAETTLPEALAAAAPDYRTAQFGKWHLANGPNTPSTIGGWPLFSGSLIGALTNYYGWTKTSNGVSAGTTAYATTDLVNNAAAWIAAQGTNRWLAWCAFNAPHIPLHKPPTNLCPDYAGLSGLQADINANPRNYFEAMVQSLDTEMARLLAVVDLTNTTVIFLGDNGTASQAVTPPVTGNRAKDSLYEGGVHVPLIVSGAAVAYRGRTSDTPVHAVDLFATILELAGTTPAAAIPAGTLLDSQSLLPLLQGTNAVALRPVYGELFGTNKPAGTAGQFLRNDRYKLIRLQNRSEAFFDLASDAYETANLLTNALDGAQTSNYHGLAFALGRYEDVFTNAIAGFGADGGVTVARNTNVTYALWRAALPSDNAWTPVTNAAVTTNGGFITLREINALADGPVFYSVMGVPP